MTQAGRPSPPPPLVVGIRIRLVVRLPLARRPLLRRPSSAEPARPPRRVRSPQPASELHRRRTDPPALPSTTDLSALPSPSDALGLDLGAPLTEHAERGEPGGQPVARRRRARQGGGPVQVERRRADDAQAGRARKGGERTVAGRRPRRRHLGHPHARRGRVAVRLLLRQPQSVRPLPLALFPAAYASSRSPS